MAATPKVSVAVVAKFLDVTERRVQQLVREGIIPKSERGKYDLYECVKAYIRHLRDREDRDHPNYAIERARLAKAQREKAESENRRIKGELVEVEAVRMLWRKIFTNVRTRILSLPVKLAPVLEGQNKATIKDKIESALHESLHEIADHAPEIGSEAQLEHKPGDNDSDGARRDAAAAQADRKPVGRRKKKVKPGK